MSFVSIMQCCGLQKQYIFTIFPEYADFVVAYMNTVVYYSIYNSELQ